MGSRDFVDVQEACRECGDARAVVRDGFLYCMECGMRAAESQPILEFTRDEIVSGIKLNKTKITKAKTDLEKYENMWTTWHAHNMILVGLVEEICSCGAKEYGLGQTVLMLWARWLRYNRIAFFSKINISAPMLTFGYQPRDLEFLYGIKKPKKKKITHPPSVSVRQASKDKIALVKHEYVEFMASQSTKIDMASQELKDIKAPEAEKPKRLELNKKARKYFTKLMTPDDLELHLSHGMCKSRCRCLSKKKCLIYDRINQLSIMNLYALLFLGLRINHDVIHLGDMIRWCRESHLSYGSYNHFFPSDMLIKVGDRFSWNSNKMSNSVLRLTAGRLAKVLKIKKISSPNLQPLIKRYIKELELPDELFYLVLKLQHTLPKLMDHFPLKCETIPNYEGIAMSYIIIVLKIIFGLDGVVEYNISSSVENINSVLNLGKERKDLENETKAENDSKDTDIKRIFVWNDWVRYIEYRKICLSQCHYPTTVRLDPDNVDNPELFLHHKKTCNKRIEEEISNTNPAFLVIKSLLEDIQTDYNVLKKEFPTFSCSTRPMSSYTETLLAWQSPYSDFQICTDILNEDFPSYRIKCLLNPVPLKLELAKLNYQLIAERCVSNPNITSDIGLKISLLELSDRLVPFNIKQHVKVVDCTAEQWTDDLFSDKIISNTTRGGKLKSAGQIIKLAEIKNNLFLTSKRVNNSFKLPASKSRNSFSNGRINLSLCYRDYWLRHYSSMQKYSKIAFEEELDSSYPPSFSWLLRECASATEMSTLDLYKELCIIEKQLVKKNPQVLPNTKILPKRC